jgi:hypothetical protein
MLLLISAAGYKIEMIEKQSTIGFSIFFCGCNQSQIFPRSGDKSNTVLSIFNQNLTIF